MTTEVATNELPDGEYAIVEQIGHTTFVGRIAEIERFGSKMMQIEPIFAGKLLGPLMIGGGTIYRLTPCNRDVALRSSPKHGYQLPSAVRATIEPALISSAATDGSPVDDDASGAGDNEGSGDDFY